MFWAHENILSIASHFTLSYVQIAMPDNFTKKGRKKNCIAKL